MYGGKFLYPRAAKEETERMRMLAEVDREKDASKLARREAFDKWNLREKSGPAGADIFSERGPDKLTTVVPFSDESPYHSAERQRAMHEAGLGIRAKTGLERKEAADLRMQSLINAGKQGGGLRDTFADRSAAYKQAGVFMNELFPVDDFGVRINPRTKKPFTEKEWTSTRKILADQSMEYAGGNIRRSLTGQPEQQGGMLAAGNEPRPEIPTVTPFRSEEFGYLGSGGYSGDLETPPVYPTRKKQMARTPQQGFRQMYKSVEPVISTLGTAGKWGKDIGLQGLGLLGKGFKGAYESQVRARQRLGG